MPKYSKIQQIKLVIKASIILGVLIIFVVLGIFVRPVTSFENSYMKKWLSLDEAQRVITIQRVVKNTSDQELLMKCVDKIASLPDSNEMLIRDAIVICHNGIQMNAENNEE